MSRRVVTAIVAVLVVAGCTEDREQSPTAPAGPDFLVGATCRYNDVKQYARDLFGSTGAGTVLANQMSKFGPNTTQATNLGFDILQEIASQRDAATDLAWNPLVETAAKLTEQVIFCSNVFLTAGNTEPALERLANLTKALTKPEGGYAVRAGKAGAQRNGTPDPETPVLTSDLQSGVDATSDTWADWFGSRTLLYGYPTDEFIGESREAIYGNAAYDWSLVRASPMTTSYPGKGKVSICITYDKDLYAEDVIDKKFRLQKPTTILEVAAPVDGLDCQISDATAPGDQFAARPLPTRLAEFAAGLLLPERLHAAFLAKATTKPTGSAGSFSVFQGGDPEMAHVEWVHAPADGTLRRGIPSVDRGEPVTVKVTGGEDTPWQGVKLRIYGEDNNGAKVPFDGACVETNSAGVAEFPDLAAPKSGGYNLFVETHPSVTGCSVDPDVDSFDAVTVPAPDRIIVRP
jgi:hypothetical protein